MGLIKAATSAIGSTFGDQFLSAISCQEMGNDLLMIKKTNKDGILAKGSKILVAPGQVAAIMDNGVILDATAEPGVYEFNKSSTPSFFGGEFGAVFKEMWQRFKFGGATYKEQAVYFFNVKEIMNNKFGTANAVPYKDWGHPILNPRTNQYVAMSVEVKCYGKYTFKIANPALFMTQIAGIAETYTKAQLVEQIRSEVLGAFTNIMNSLGEEKYKIEVLSLPNKTDEIRDIMKEEVFDEPIRNRGIELVSFVVESLTLEEDSKKKIDTYEIGGDAYQQQGMMSQAYSEAIKNAASNKSGTLNGFMGIGMMNMATGGGAFSKTNAPNEQIQPQMTTNSEEWICSCGTKNVSKFCSECGKPKKLRCPKCETENINSAKFCSNCGEKLEK